MFGARAFSAILTHHWLGMKRELLDNFYGGGIRASISNVHFAAANAHCRGKVPFAAPKPGPGHLPRQISLAGHISLCQFLCDFAAANYRARTFAAPKPGRGHFLRQISLAWTNFIVPVSRQSCPGNVPARIRPFAAAKDTEPGAY